MSNINNTYALYPEYIDNQKELLVGCNEKKVKVKYTQETSDTHLRVSGHLLGKEPHIDNHYKQALETPLEKRILYSYPWSELKWDPAYITESNN